MTEQQRPDEDVEGHKKSYAQSEEGLEEAVEDDVEGHSLNVRRPQ